MDHQRGPADLVLVNGTVYTADASRSRAAGLAVRQGRIVGVGTDEEMRARAGPATEVLDLAGRMVVPGFQDSHVHPMMAGVEMNRCDLTGGRSRYEYVAMVADYASAHPGEPWIRGGGWSMPAFPNGVPLAADLDAVADGRPVYLPNRDHHSAWVSSRALAMAGITRDTPDPLDGRIERDGHGDPTGALHEGAMYLVERLVPANTRRDYVDGLVTAQTELHRRGITAWQDAWIPAGEGPEGALEAYLEAAGDGRLTARVVGALWWERDQDEGQIERLAEIRNRSSVGRFRASSVKIMQDGVCETFTAALLTPYLDSHGHETDNCGLSFVEPEALRRYVTLLDAAGFQVHVHAIGDRAVREALDAVETARRANGMNDLRHHLAHLQVVHPDDLPRFGPLGVVANFQPLWAYEEEQMVTLTMPFLGAERTAWQYPIGSLRAHGARIAFGSDWPVSTPDPFAEMHVAVHRSAPVQDPDFRPGLDPFLPAERVDLATALDGFTRGAAYVNHLEGETGSIEVGKLADLAVLDRDLFAVDEADGGISAARVDHTFVEGRPVHDAGR